jgi:TadE-like protein
MRGTRDRGQTLVEFAIVIPIFLTLLMGVVDFGRVVWAQSSLASAAREAARFAIVHGGSGSNPCPVGPPANTAQIPLPSASCPYPSPSRQAIRDVATNYAMAGGIGLTVTVCYGAGCSGDNDVVGPPPALNSRGTPVTVTVSSTVPLTVPSLLGFSSFSVSGSSTMLVNH